MKRSEINNIICENKRLCNEARFYLPRATASKYLLPFAYGNAVKTSSLLC